MYTDKNQIEAYLGITLPSSLDDQLDNWIQAVQNYLDNYVGFSFENTTETSRYYDGSGERELFVDKYYELGSVVTLDVDGDTDVTVDSGDGSGVVQYPLNSDRTDRLYLPTDAPISKFPSHRNAVKVTAKFGWSAEAPQDIQLTATRLMAHLIQPRLSGNLGEKTQESLGDYSVSFAKLDETAKLLGVTNILDQYRNLCL
jgi:hypothetical protein